MKMPEWFLKIYIPVLSLVLGGLIIFLRMKWKLQQDRKTAWARKREPIYAQGLEFIYEGEKHQTNEEELKGILERWAEWFPLNAIYLPPSVNDALFGAMHWTNAVRNNLSNNESNEKIFRNFKEKLQKAKKDLMELKDIGWLPEDLK